VFVFTLPHTRSTSPGNLSSSTLSP